MTKFGIFTFATDYSLGPARLAREVEDRGFESLFLPEHSHIPISRDQSHIVLVNRTLSRSVAGTICN